MADIPTCKTCRWWTGSDTSHPSGICRRLPPMVADVSRLIDLRPVTAPDDWCGEHQPNQPAEAAPGQPDTPPSPRIDPETRRVMEDAARDACYIAEDVEDGNYPEAMMVAKKSAAAIRAHLAKLDGEDSA